MRLRLPFPALFLALVLVACSRDEAASPDAAPATATPEAPSAARPTADAEPEAAVAADEVSPNWEPRWVLEIEAMAAKIRAAGIPCNEFEVVPAEPYRKTLAESLKLADEDMPIAEAYCTSEQEEDITFTMFPDAARAQAFVGAKQAALCRRAKKLNLPEFPGFPYVAGDNWLVQPDERVTSVRLAEILGGTAGMATCDPEAQP